MRASYPSILVFSWVSSIIHVGWKKPLTKYDLYDLDPDNTCNVVNLKFVKNWDAQAHRRARNDSEIRPRLSVLLPLVMTYYGIFLKGSFLALMSALLQQVRSNYGNEFAFFNLPCRLVPISSVSSFTSLPMAKRCGRVIYMQSFSWGRISCGPFSTRSTSSRCRSWD